MSFFHLPVELRDEVYKHAVSLKTKPLAGHEGLVLTNGRINQEMEPEGRRLVRDQLKHIKRDLLLEHGLQFDISNSFRDLRHLRLSLSTSVHARGVGPDTKLSSPTT